MTHDNRIGARIRGAVLASAAATVCLVLSLPVRGNEQTGMLTPEDAAALMSINGQIQTIETKALDGDVDYNDTLARAKAADDALAEHRAAFEARRNADYDYAQVRDTVQALNAQKASADDQLLVALAARRNNESELANARAAVAAARPHMSRLQRDADKYQKLYDHLMTDTDDDAGTNNSGTRANSLAAMKARVDKAQSDLAEWRTKVEAAEARIAAAQAKTAGITQQVNDARASQHEAVKQLTGITQRLTVLEREWENKYQADPQTATLRTAAEEANKQLQTVRVSALTTLKSDAQYAQLIRQRSDIEKRRAR